MRGNDKVPSYLRDHLSQLDSAADKGEGVVTDNTEGACPAFGFLRGMDARALAVEFRLRTGDSEWFSYSCLVSWRHNPSAGLLLKFTTGDGVSLVLIHGSNLDAPAGQAQVNLTDRGLQRHRIVFVREMDEAELRRSRGGEPTIDRIDIAEFETAEEQREWLKARRRHSSANRPEQNGGYALARLPSPGHGYNSSRPPGRETNPCWF